MELRHRCEAFAMESASGQCFEDRLLPPAMSRPPRIRQSRLHRTHRRLRERQRHFLRRSVHGRVFHVAGLILTLPPEISPSPRQPSAGRGLGRGASTGLQTWAAVAFRQGGLLSPTLSSKGGEGGPVVGWWQCQDALPMTLFYVFYLTLARISVNDDVLRLC